MSDEDAKAFPQGPPPEPSELAERFDRAVKEPEVRREFQIRLNVEGGHAGERYEFRFHASGTGDAEVSLVDNLRERRRETLLEASRSRPRIPPGSVVGRLEVGDGRQEISVLFMADPGQAESAGYRMPPELAEILQRLYDLGAKHLGEKDVRP
jgi:hypothetical protein